MRVVATLAALAGLAAGPALAQDAAEGEALFKRCAGCHMVGENAKTRSGPILNGLFGRAAGSLPDYKFSEAMIAAGAGGLVWTPETVAQFLLDPRGYVPGTKMAFPGFKTEEEAAHVAAYLLGFSPDYVPAPAGAEGGGAEPPPAN